MILIVLIKLIIVKDWLVFRINHCYSISCLWKLCKILYCIFEIGIFISYWINFGKSGLIIIRSLNIKEPSSDEINCNQ